MGTHTPLNLNCFTNKYNNDEKGFKSEILDTGKYQIYTQTGITEFKNKLDKLIEKGTNDILSKNEYETLEKGLQDLKELKPYKVKLNNGKLIEFFIKAIPDKKEEEEESIDKEEFTDEEPVNKEEENNKENEGGGEEEDPNEEPENQDLPDGTEIEYKGQKYVKVDGEWQILGEDIEEEETNINKPEGGEGEGEGGPGEPEGDLTNLQNELNSDKDLNPQPNNGEEGEQSTEEKPNGNSELPEEKPAIPKGSKTLQEHASDTTTEDLKLFIANPHNDDSLKDIARTELEKRGELEDKNDSPLSQRELLLDMKDQLNELTEKVNNEDKDKIPELEEEKNKKEEFEEGDKLKSSPDNKNQMNTEIIKEEKIAEDRKEKKEKDNQEPDKEEEENKEDENIEKKENEEKKDPNLKSQPNQSKEEEKEPEPKEKEEKKDEEDEDKEKDEEKKKKKD